MDQRLLSLEEDISNYNKVKDLVVGQIMREGYMSEEEGNEFAERCQVMIYKGTWFKRWFDRNMKNKEKEGWYMKIVEMHDKQTSIDDIIRRTANER